MNCEQIESWISADQESELDGRRRLIVREHLARCLACQALSEEWEALAREIRAGLVHEEAPAGLHERVMLRISESERPPARSAPREAWRRPPWLSWGLVPVGAAAAWLLLAPHAPRPAAGGSEGRGSIIVHLNSETASGGASKPAAPFPAARPPTKSSAAAPPKLPRRPAVISKPPPGTPRGTAQGTGHPEPEWRPRVRRLRPRRGWYPVAEQPQGGRRPRRAHSRLLLAARPSQPPAALDTPAPSSITVVDYVLPEVSPSLTLPEPSTDFVLHPAEPAVAAPAGFNL